jgi:hypothetical protein
MATKNRSMFSNYTQLNTIPALSGIAFAVASAVQFLGATFGIAPSADLAYTLDPTHALLISLVALVVAFASSDTTDWRYYETYEQGIVALAVGLMIGQEYLAEVQDLLANNAPVAGIVAFAVTMAAWGVLAR